MMPSQSVLIIGAGPTGLMMACQLSRYDIPFRIIEKNSGPSEKSKALALQSRSLEIYDQMGIASVAINNGHQTKGINFIVKGKRVQRIPLNDVGNGISPFPFLHIYEQNKNELLLLNYLKEKNISVEWNTELKSLSQNEKEVIAIVKKNNSEEEIRTPWLVGADGGSSPVRHQLNISFPGETYENIFYVADTAVEWNIGYDELFLYVSRNTFTGFFPMQGNNRFRLVGVLPEKFQTLEHVTFDDIKATISNELENNISFNDTKWFSVYRLHHRCVENFRSGRCFLAGDAAHIHSPAGGQGMNTGLQDAYNLAWKIALVEKNLAGVELLDSYNTERLPFAQRLVKTTDRIFGFAVSDKPLVRFIRVNIFPWLARIAMSIYLFRIFAFKTISQVALNYRKSRINVNDMKRNSGKVKAGDRLPYCLIIPVNEKKLISIYDLLKQPTFHILVFNRKSQIMSDEIKKHFNSSPFFKVIEFNFSEENKNAYDKFGVKDLMICIVRPDNYIGYLGDELNSVHIQKYFHATSLFQNQTASN